MNLKKKEKKGKRIKFVSKHPLPYHLHGKNWNPFHRFLGLYSWSWIGQSENPFPFVKWVPWNKKKINATLQISLHRFTVLNMNIAFLPCLELFGEIYLHCLVMMTVVQFPLELSNNSIFAKQKACDFSIYQTCQTPCRF